MAMFSGRNQLWFWIPSALVAVALVIAIFLGIRPRSGGLSSQYLVGNPVRGAELFYGEKQCGICHSLNGSGGRIAPDLTGSRPTPPAMGWLVSVLWNHGPSMWRQIRHSKQPYPKLDPQEMADMLAFLYQTSNIDNPGDPGAGAKVFTEKGCSRCHAIGAEGATKAPELSAIAAGGDPDVWTVAMLNHAGSMVGPITQTLGEWPKLSGNDMNNLIAYAGAGSSKKEATPVIFLGNGERGWVVFQARCIQCHSARGQGGGIGPDLGPTKDLPLSTAEFGSVMWNHAPAMLQQAKQSGLPAPQLKDVEMADLLAFLASLRYFEPTGSPQVGERVFAIRGCAACHGTKAQGTNLGPSLKAGPEAYTAVTFTSGLWRHGPAMMKRSEETNMPWPTLQPGDIGELVSFLNAH